MTEFLVEEFAKVGLELNGSKSKILTNELLDYDFLDIAGDLVEIIDDSKTHRYLGRFLSGNLDARGGMEVAHRIQCVWWKFGQNDKSYQKFGKFRQVLTILNNSELWTNVSDVGQTCVQI